MSAVSQDVQNTSQNQTENVQNNPPKNTDKEYNFAQIRQQLEREKIEKQQLKEEIEKLKKITQERLVSQEDDEIDNDEPYIDHKRLKKELGKVVKQTTVETDNRIQSAVNKALAEERQKQWLKNNPDFFKIMEHAQDFADKDPELAETILEMPEGFERQKLVYKNIKALGLHKPPETSSAIQNKIDQNQRSPYYQPTNIANPGYGIVNGGKTYTPAEGKNAYMKMLELKERLRI
jgi:hypothetical protein